MGKTITKIVVVGTIPSFFTAFSTLPITSLSSFNTETTTAAVTAATTAPAPTRSFLANKEYSYDLGIGKNQPLHVDLTMDPVVSAVGDDHRGDDNNHGVANYMVQHESTREFPSPLLDDGASASLRLPSTRDETVSGSGRHEPKKSRRKVLPKVEPKRQLEDVLFILTDDLGESSIRSEERLPSTYGNHGHPVMVHPAGNGQLDINSIWVEMLIHNQQNDDVPQREKCKEHNLMHMYY